MNHPSSPKNLQTLVAPLAGTLVELDQVSDPIFANKILGDGIAIEPESDTLAAPCDGLIVKVHPAKHALTLQTDTGIKLLLHIGIDTVLQRGQGFECLIEQGQRVSQGDPLIRFDRQALQSHVASLATVMVITNSENVLHFIPSKGAVSGGEKCLQLLLEGQAANAPVHQAEEPWQSSAPIELLLAEGLHARPSANLVALAKQFSADTQIEANGRTANARSVTALLGLNTVWGDKLIVQAKGSDAKQALMQLEQAIREGLGDELSPVAQTEAAPDWLEEAPLIGKISHDPNVLQGVAASPGLAVGQLLRLQEERFEYPELSENSGEALATFTQALEQAASQLQQLRDEVIAQGSEQQAEIFSAHQELLSDPDLVEHAKAGIIQGKSAAYAWQQAIDNQSQTLASLNNALLAGRVSDLEDIGKRVLRLILGQAEPSLQLQENTILLARDLTPSVTAKLDTSKVIGFATTEGGASSHSAILARSMNLPAIAAVDDAAMALADQTNVVLDGYQGQLKINLSDEQLGAIRQQQADDAKLARQDKASAHLAAVTVDGEQLEVVANIANADDARASVELGGEGVGLLRSEFMFLNRASAPDEDEQYHAYKTIIEQLDGRPIIIRTLDVGGDKPLSFLPMPEEENPFLGERGIRIGIRRPAILRTQVRGILRAAKEAKSLVRIMFPMVGTIEELRAAKALVVEEANSLEVSNYEIGIMVEVPSTAVMADVFAKEVDFFSIGSNDLTQYCLAVDRGHPKLAAQLDGIHPAVLRLIDMTVKGAHKHGKWVGVCGGIASDVQAVPLLLGLGVDELSTSVPALPEVKAQIRELDMTQCKTLASTALSLATAEEVRQLSPGRMPVLAAVACP